PLTAAAVLKYQPTDKRRIIRDGGARSLFLIVAPSGHKSWQMRFRTAGGRIGKVTLGPVDFSGRELVGTPTIGMPLTMAAARLLSAEVLRQRALGHDPVADNKAQKHRARLVAEERAGNTFGAAACDFVVEYKIKKKGRRPRRWAEVARCLGFTIALSEDSKTLTATPIKHGLADKWAAKPIAEITEDDLFIVVRDAQRGGIPGLTKRIKGTSDARGRKMADALSGFFRWLKKERRIPVNLMRDIEWRPAAGKRRLRRLSDDELRWLWHGLDAAVKAHEVPKSFAAMVRLLLVTATRRDEARLMMSTEFKNNDWIIPAARVKSDVSHLVPLSTLARDILLRQADARGFVFTLD